MEGFSPGIIDNHAMVDPIPPNIKHGANGPKKVMSWPKPQFLGDV